jgi:hypothetical protein
MKHQSTPNKLWFTAPIAILLAIAAGGGVFINGLYRDVPGIVAQAKGQDLISLVVVLPSLMITAILARRGSLQARFIWLGGIVYMVYTYASFAFAIQYNPLFLVYIALLGCSLYALIDGLATLDMAGIKARTTEKTPARAVSVYLAVLAFLFCFLWLSELIPALVAGEIPQSILEDGTPTNAIHVLDLAWILPAFVITSISLWRKHSLGYTLAAVLLSFFVLLASATLSMALFEARGGNPDAIPMAGFFGTLIALAVGMLTWYLRSLRLPQGMGNEEAVNELTKIQMHI